MMCICTAFPILTAIERAAEEAGAAMARGVTSTFTYTAAENLGEVHVADLPDGRIWLKRKLQTTLLPLLSRGLASRMRIAIL